MLSGSLDVYKAGLLKEMMLTIGNLHRSALEAQSFFAHVMKNSLQNHVKIFDSLSQWMTKLLELFGCIKPNVPMPIPTVPPPMTTDASPASTWKMFHDGDNKINHIVTRRNRDR